MKRLREIQRKLETAITLPQPKRYEWDYNDIFNDMALLSECLDITLNALYFYSKESNFVKLANEEECPILADDGETARCATLSVEELLEEMP